MSHPSGAGRRFAGTLAGTALLLAVGGCTAAPPSATSSPAPSATPGVSASASSTPDAPLAPAWTGTGNMVTARTEHTATLLADGKVLVVGGLSGGDAGSALRAAELYDPASGNWTATGAMIKARWNHTATLLPDGRVLVTGGTGGASAELYDPGSANWTATAEMIQARSGHTATLLLDGKVLVAGGDGRNVGSLASAELYDPARGTWTATGQMIKARSDHMATLLLGGKVLVAGGCCGGTNNDGSTELASAELFDPRTGSWTAAGEMVMRRAEHTATLLPDGTVLVAGGVVISGGLAPDPLASGELMGGYEPNPLASAELYDPGSGDWTATGDMTDARWPATATLLPDGTVLVAGGGGGLRSSAELYGSRSFTSTRPMIQNRSSHTATLLFNGTVLVAGGTDNSAGTSLASAELYDPSRRP